MLRFLALRAMKSKPMPPEYGWPAAVASPSRRAVLALSLLSWALIDRRSYMAVGSSTDVDSRTHRCMVATGAASLGIAVLLMPYKRFQVQHWPRLAWVAGIILLWGGIGLRQWAIAVLGDRWRPILSAPPGELVFDGPYRLVRHPSYLGALLAQVGIGLAMGSRLSLAAMSALPIVGYARRIRVEERALFDAHGTSYDRYSSQRARLIPGVW